MRDMSQGISFISLGIACLSLGWQVAIWLFSAGRPKANLLYGIMASGSAYVGEVRRDGTPPDVSDFAQQGIVGTPVLGVKVTVRGRAPVTVDRIEVHSQSRKLSIVPIGMLQGNPLPHRLEAGTNSNWYIPIDAVIPLTKVSKNPYVYITVQLGSGKNLKTRGHLRLS